MPEKYEGLGFSMLYPETWKLHEDQGAATVALETSSGAFLTITACSNLLEAFEHAEQTMQEEYDEIELEEIVMEFAGQQLYGVAQRFVYLDLIVTSKLFQLDRGEKKYLIQIQGEDGELDEHERVFDAILTSMCQSLAEPSG